jgi:hypothetical protein
MMMKADAIGPSSSVICSITSDPSSIIIKVEHLPHFPFRSRLFSPIISPSSRHIGFLPSFLLLHLDWRIELVLKFVILFVIFFRFHVFVGRFLRFNYGAGLNQSCAGKNCLSMTRGEKHLKGCWRQF